jgi:hypothetical protein
MIQKIIYIFSIITLTWFNGKASGIKFTANTTRTTVAVNEPFQIQFIVENANLKSFEYAGNTGVQALQGPFQSNQSYQINNKVTSSIIFTYVVRATQPGKINIGPAKAQTIAGQTIESNSIQIEVVKGNTNPPNNNNAPSDNSTDISNEIFLRVFVDKNSVYEGEQITATYKLYTRVNLVSYQFDKMPSLNGFWTNEFDIKQGQAVQETINGQTYSVVELKKVGLFPQQTGNLTLDPVKMEVIARVPTRNKKRSMIDDFFNNPFFNDPFFNSTFNTYQDLPINLSSGTATIQVKKLPEPKPEGFNGAVGQFNFSAKLDKSSITTDDALTYKIMVTGSGNLNLMDNPKLELPTDFEVYEPKILENIPKNANPIGGSKTYEYLILPHVPGDYKIPAAKFCYFNPIQKKYITVDQNAIDIKVTAGKNIDQNKSTVNQEAIKVLNKDIEYIYTKPLTLTKTLPHFYGSFIMWLLALIPFLTAIGAFVYFQFNKEQFQNKAIQQNKKALKVANSRLKTASLICKPGNEKQFYNEILKCLQIYMSHKLKIPLANINLENMITALQVNQVDNEQINKFIALNNNCERALYGQSNVDGSMATVLANAKTLIIQLESKLKSNN